MEKSVPKVGLACIYTLFISDLQNFDYSLIRPIAYSLSFSACYAKLKKLFDEKVIKLANIGDVAKVDVLCCYG